MCKLSIVVFLLQSSLEHSIVLQETARKGSVKIISVSRRSNTTKHLLQINYIPIEGWLVKVGRYRHSSCSQLQISSYRYKNVKGHFSLPKTYF